MLIEFVSPSPKAGKREHHKPIIAEAMIAAGFAIKIEDPNAASAPTTDAVAPFFKEARWFVTKKDSGKFFIVRQYCSETTLFYGPPPAEYEQFGPCPGAVIREWRELTGRQAAVDHATSVQLDQVRNQNGRQP